MELEINELSCTNLTVEILVIAFCLLFSHSPMNGSVFCAGLHVLTQRHKISANELIKYLTFIQIKWFERSKESNKVAKVL